MAVRLRPYLELIRLPAVFTAPADVLAGAALVGASDLATLLPLIGASAAVYCAGMAANDVFDARSIDIDERPGRPIPSGRVSLGSAWALVLGLQALGLAIAAWVGWTSLLLVAATISATYLYNGIIKGSAIGSFGMGLCRYGNACIGASAVGWPLTCAAWLVPLTTAIYVTALTTLSGYEVVTAARTVRLRIAGYALIPTALGVLLWPIVGVLTPEPPWLIGAAIVPCVWLGRAVRRVVSAPSPGSARSAVQAGIFGIALVNGVIALWAGNLALAAIIVLLLVPGRIVGRWFYAT